MFNRAMELALLYKERVEILDEENDLWMKNCKDCTLVQDAVASGVLGKGTWKDRKNPICDACPAQPKIRDMGYKLEENIREIKWVRNRV